MRRFLATLSSEAMKEGHLFVSRTVDDEQCSETTPDVTNVCLRTPQRAELINVTRCLPRHATRRDVTAVTTDEVRQLGRFHRRSIRQARDVMGTQPV